MQNVKKMLVLLMVFCLMGLSSVVVFAEDANDTPDDDVTVDDTVDDDSDDDSEDDDDSDDDDDDDVCTQERARERIETAEQKYEKARLRVEEKESQGKDVSKARESLELAQQELEQARLQLESGECDNAEGIAKQSKHRSNLAKGKDVVSTSLRAQTANAFGKCISEAAKAKDFAKFADCHAEFKSKIDDQIEDELSDEDQDANEEINQKVRELIDNEEDEDIKAALGQFLDFNYSGVSAEDVLADINEILDDEELSKEEKIEKLNELLDELKETSSEDKYDDGVIPFVDTDDSDWFFAYADVLKEEACIEGFVTEEGALTGEFHPEEDVLFGDSLKFILSCLLDEQPVEIGEDDFWALAWAQVLIDEYSEYIEENLLARTNEAIADTLMFGEGVTRAELLAYILDILEAEVPEATEEPFSDVSLDHEYVDAIAYALEQGIISGDEEEDTFRPDDVPNRAETIKIIIMVKELL